MPGGIPGLHGLPGGPGFPGLPGAPGSAPPPHPLLSGLGHLGNGFPPGALPPNAANQIVGVYTVIFFKW